MTKFITRRPIFSIIVAVIVSFSIGAAAASGSTETVKSEPKVETKTETVTKEVVPEGCLIAIKAAEDIGDLSSEFADVMLGYLPLISKAYERGSALDPDVSDITERMNELTAQNEDINKRLKAAVDAFNAGKADCK